jgi:hypothetical protein
MPPEWVLQGWPDDDSAGNRFVIAFWFVCLPLYWIYLSLVTSQTMGAGLGQAIAPLLYLAFVLTAILLAGMVCLGGVIFVMVVLAVGATIVAIQHARTSSD